VAASSSRTSSHLPTATMTGSWPFCKTDAGASLSKAKAKAPPPRRSGTDRTSRWRSCRPYTTKTSRWACATSTFPVAGTSTPGGCRSLRCLSAGWHDVTRSGTGEPSFRRTYTRTPPSPWTRRGGITPPTSPARGAGRVYSACRVQLCHRSVPAIAGAALGAATTGGRGGGHGGAGAPGGAVPAAGPIGEEALPSRRASSSSSATRRASGRSWQPQHPPAAASAHPTTTPPHHRHRHLPSPSTGDTPSGNRRLARLPFS
jgi:hypothetical protein